MLGGSQSRIISEGKKRKKMYSLRILLYCKLTLCWKVKELKMVGLTGSYN